jgi:replication-associated recombination protein RarA
VLLGVEELLLNHSLLSITERTKVPFTSTGLHRFYTLYGPPGTGKTTLARAANAARLKETQCSCNQSFQRTSSLLAIKTLRAL